MKSFKMEVSKKGEKEGDKRVPVGTIEAFYPLLDEMGLSVTHEKEDDEGFPVYSDERVQFVFDSVLAATRAIVRNRLVNGTVTLRPGASIPTTVEALIERSERNGEALQNRRDCLKAFSAFLPTSGKSEKLCRVVAALFGSKENLALASNKRKTQVSELVGEFVESLNEVDQNRFSSYLTQVAEACELTEDEEDDE